MNKVNLFKYFCIFSISTLGLSSYAVGEDAPDIRATQSRKTNEITDSSSVLKSDDYSLKTLQWLREVGKKQVGEASFKMAIHSMQQQDWGKAKQLIYEAVNMEQDNEEYLNMAIYIAYNQHDYKMSEVFLLRLLSIQKDTLEDNPVNHANFLDNLALIYTKQKRFDDARKLIKMTLSMNEANIGEHFPKLIVRLYRMADLNVQLGDYGDAVQQMKQTIQLYEQNPNDFSEQEIAKAYHNIGDIYRIQKHFGNAETAYLKALEFWQETTEQGKSARGLTLKNLSQVQTELKFQNRQILMSTLK